VPDPPPDQSRSRRSGNPAVRAGAVPPSPARAKVERRSLPLLVRLNAVPRWLLLVVVLLLAVAGLLLPGIVGAALLLVVGALAAWLLVLSWPALGPGARAARVLILVLIMFDVGLKVSGRAG
jgi:uncharacterized membrane protein